MGTNLVACLAGEIAAKTQAVMDITTMEKSVKGLTSIPKPIAPSLTWATF